MIIIILRIIGLLALAASLYPATHNSAQSGNPFKMRVDVDLVTIEISALDSSGNPVQHLKKENFQLYEDGKRQEIVSCDEVDENSKESPAAMPLFDRGDSHRGKTVLIVFIDAFVDPQFFQQSRESAGRFVKEHMRTQDMFAVASYGKSMKILRNLTDDKNAVLAGIAHPPSVDSTGFDFADLSRSLQAISYSLAPLKGRKSVLIYAHVPDPGRPAYPNQPLSNPLSPSPSSRPSYQDALTAARKSNVAYYLIYPVRGSTDGLRVGQWNSNIPNASGLPTGEIPASFDLGSLASQSGGFSIIETDNIHSELDRLNQQISTYYILGFQSNNPRHDGAFRQIKIKTELKGITLKHRPGYQDRRPLDILASAKQEQTLHTALATPGAAVQLPISFRPAYFYSSPHSARVLIAAKIRTENMIFRKKGGQMSGDLNLMGAAYAENGGIVSRFSETIPVSFEKEKETEFRRSGFEYRNYFKLHPGKYRLKLAACDESGNLGSAEQFIEVPPMSGQGITFSSLVIAEQISPLSELIRNIRTQLLDENDPLLYSGMRIRPSVDNKIKSGSPVLVLFRIYHSSFSDLVVNPLLLGPGGEKFTTPPIPLNEVISPSGQGEAVVALKLPFQNVPPGKYRLVVEINGTVSGSALQADLEIVAP